MFDRLDPCMEGLGVIIWKDGNRFLIDDRPMVNLLIDEMDSDSRDGDAIFNRGLHRMGAWKRRKKCRMHVDDRIGELLDRVRCQYSHEPGEDKRTGSVASRHAGNGRSEVVSRLEGVPVDKLGGNIGKPGSLQSSDTWSIGHDHGYLKIDPVPRRIKEGLEIAPTARYQNSDQ
jgi:hypothetical protein